MLRAIFIFLTLFNLSTFANQVKSLGNLQNKYYSNIEEHLRSKMKVENLSDQQKFIIYNHAVKSLVKYNFLGFAKNYLHEILKLKTKENYTQHFIYLLQIYDNEEEQVLVNHTLEKFKIYASQKGITPRAKAYISYYSLLRTNKLSSELYKKPQRLALSKLGKTKDIQLHNIKVQIMRKNYNEIYNSLQSIKKMDMSYKLTHIYSSILVNKKTSYACNGIQVGIILNRSCKLLKEINSLNGDQITKNIKNLIGLIKAVSTNKNRNEISLLNQIIMQRQI